MKTALIAGAGGLVGKACLYQLLENNNYSRVVALVRKPLAIKHHKLQQVVVDFDQLESFVNEVKGDDVYCCLGTTIKVAGSQENFKKVDYEYPLALARLALQNGASRFLLMSAMGADVGSNIFYSRVKGEVERDITKLGYPTVHIFRPSLLLGNRKEFRAGELLAKGAMKLLGWMMIGPLRMYKGIADITVAKAMVKTALSNKVGLFIHLNAELLDIGA